MVTARNGLSETVENRPEKASRRTFRSPLPTRQKGLCFAFKGPPSRAAVALVVAVLAAFVGILVIPVGGRLSGSTVIAASPSPGGSETPASQPPASQPPASQAPASQPPAPAGRTCSGSLQALVDAAAPGSTVRLEGCIYREEVRVDKPLTLDGGTGSEIRGSDVWTGWHGGAAGTFESDERVPEAGGAGTCRPATDRCHRAEQVFLDGRPLDYAGTAPGAGQFALSDGRNVILGADPIGHVVEVVAQRRQDRLSTQRISPLISSPFFRQGGVGCGAGAGGGAAAGPMNCRASTAAITSAPRWSRLRPWRLGRP